MTISTPVRAGPEREFLGVVAMTFEVGHVVELPGAEGQFPVLVDRRDGMHKGLILQHPLLAESDTYPIRFAQPEFFVTDRRFPDTDQVKENYRDPLAQDAAGRPYDKRWLAEYADVKIDDEQTGWVVIVQESYDDAIGRTLDQMTSGLLRIVMQSLGLFVVVVTALGGIVLRSYTRGRRIGFGGAPSWGTDTQTTGTATRQGTTPGP